MPEYTCQDIELLESQIATKESELSDLQDELAALQADLSDANELLEQYKSNLENHKRLLSEKQIELARAKRELQTLKNSLAFLRLNLDRLEKEKSDILAYIQTQPEIKSLWCADYTLDLSGEVGLADVPGEMNAIQLRPGYANKAKYEASRDGILQHAKASSPANTWLHACLMPAVRKWKPQYRHGTITAINYDNDTCSIKLAEATSQYLADKFDINTTYELSNVPIEYMDCNAIPFLLGDKILIEYPDRKTPKVVGFYAYPKPCPYEMIQHMLLLSADMDTKLYIDIIGDIFFQTGDVLYNDSGATVGTIRYIDGTAIYGVFDNFETDDVVNNGEISGIVSSCFRHHYFTKYSVEIVMGGWFFSQIDNMEYGPFKGPSDFYPLSDMRCPPPNMQTWYKTLNAVTLCAYEIKVLGDGGFPTWGVKATYNGQECTFEVYGDAYTEYDNLTRYTTLQPEGTTQKLFMGFDVWMEEGDYLVSIANDAGQRINVFRLNTDTFHFAEEEVLYNIIPDGYTNKPERVRLVGHYERTAYFCFLGKMTYLKLTPSGTEEISLGEGQIDTVCWNHVTNELGVFFDPNDTTTVYPPDCVMTSRTGRNNYPSAFCSVYKNLETGEEWYTGENCEGIEFEAGPEATMIYDNYNDYFDFKCANNQGYELSYITYPEDPNPNMFISTNYVIDIITSINEQDFGDYIFGDKVFDKGSIITQTSNEMYITVLGTGVVSSSRLGGYVSDCEINGTRQIYTGHIVFDVVGGFAAEYTQLNYKKTSQWVFTSLYFYCTLDEDNPEYKFSGDENLQDVVSGFPYDAGWKAILKGGIDCEDKPIKSAVIYSNGMMKTSDGIVFSDPKYSRDRCFFMQVENNIIDCP